MTKTETAGIMTLLQAMYPDSFRGMSNEMMKARVTMWASIFQDEQLKLVQAAVQAFIATDTKGFAPAPGQIKEQIAILKNQAEITEQEAWEMVMAALRNSTYYSQDEFNKLPEEVQRAVGSAYRLRDWATVPSVELQTVIASNFKREYRSIIANRKAMDKIPERVKEIAMAEEKKLLEA